MPGGAGGWPTRRPGAAGVIRASQVPGAVCRLTGARMECTYNRWMLPARGAGAGGQLTIKKIANTDLMDPPDISFLKKSMLIVYNQVL